MDTLTPHDVELLDFESRTFPGKGKKDDAIRNELGVNPIRYYQRLNELLDKPAAAQYAPLLVSRLRRVREGRR